MERCNRCDYKLPLLNYLHAWEFSILLLSSADFFQNQLFQKFFQEHIRVSNSLDPDKVQHSVCPDPSPNCLKRLSADNKSLLGMIGLLKSELSTT